MKKFLLLSALALGLMTSCSDEEYIPSSSIDANSIAFSTQPKAATRSGSTITSLEKFTVDAINTDGSKYFSGTEFVFNSNMGVFQSNTPYYWPTTNTLSFYAINAPGTVSYNEQNVPEYTYQYWGGETDLVAAAVRSGEKRIPYPLTFKHLTSQIYVSAEAENKVEDLTYKLVSVKMTTPSSGTYSFATQTDGVGTWDIDNSSCSEYSYNKELPVSFLKNGHVDFSSLYWNILPLKEGTIQFKIEYQVIKNGKITKKHIDRFADAFKKSKTKFDMIVFDEAHRVKNPSSMSAKTLMKLKAKRRIGLSGTVIMNKPEDAYVPLKWTDNVSCNYT